MIELSNYVFEPLREGEEYIVYSGRREGELPAILVVAPVSEYPALASLERLEHEKRACGLGVPEIDTGVDT